MKLKVSLVFGICALLPLPLFAALPNCNVLAGQIAAEKAVPQQELTEILHSLNQHQQLPSKFVTKKTAQAAGWRPGQSLWEVLPGKSIGGDRFGNRERRLPSGAYFEADLDYQGKKRNAKRLVYQTAGKRYITVDHYASFTEIPACQ